MSVKKIAPVLKQKPVLPLVSMVMHSEDTIFPEWKGHLPKTKRKVPDYYTPANEDPTRIAVSIRLTGKMWKDVQLVKRMTGRSAQALHAEALELLFLKYLGRLTRKA